MAVYLMKHMLINQMHSAFLGRRTYAFAVFDEACILYPSLEAYTLQANMKDQMWNRYIQFSPPSPSLSPLTHHGSLQYGDSETSPSGNSSRTANTD